MSTTQMAVIFCETSNPTKRVIDEPPTVRITGQRRPDRGTFGKSSADRDYRMSTYDNVLASHLRKFLASISETGAEPVRRVKAGSVIVREYQGKLHEDMVIADGLLWQGQIYSSLSTIALIITGTSWNGPRFFGLRGGVDPAPSSAAAHEAIGCGDVSVIHSHGRGGHRGASSVTVAVSTEFRFGLFISRLFREGLSHLEFICRNEYVIGTVPSPSKGFEKSTALDSRS
jgi:hypothetical protein